METRNVCPGCGKSCELSAPSCPRGEEYVRTGVMPERSSRGGHEHGHEHKHEHGHSERAEGSVRRGKGGPPISAQEYAQLGTDEKLIHMLRHLGFLSRFGFDGRGGQARILRTLLRDGPMTQKELTEKLSIQPGSASEAIGKVERAGLLVRTESIQDRRTVNVTLTEEGERQAQLLESRQPADLFAALSSEERQTLLPLLEKLSADWEKRKAEHNVEVR